MPQHLDEIAAPAAEDEQIAPVRIALQLLLHGQRQTIEAFAHVGVAGRNPDLHALWNRDHRRSNTASTRSSAAMSTLASNVTRASASAPLRAPAPASAQPRKSGLARTRPLEVLRPAGLRAPLCAKSIISPA